MKSIQDVFTQLLALLHFGTRFRGQKVKVQGHSEIRHAENALFDLVNGLMRCVESFQTEFHQTFRVDAFWDKDEHFNFGVKMSKVKVKA